MDFILSIIFSYFHINNLQRLTGSQYLFYEIYTSIPEKKKLFTYFKHLTQALGMEIKLIS